MCDGKRERDGGTSERLKTETETERQRQLLLFSFSSSIYVQRRWVGFNLKDDKRTWQTREPKCNQSGTCM